MILEISCFIYSRPDGNWSSCWIFKSKKFYILTRSGGSRHITMPNFPRNWSIQSRGIAIFRFYKWPPPPSWIFEIAKFYRLTGARGSRRMSVPNIVKIGLSVADILQFFEFSRWPPLPPGGSNCQKNPYVTKHMRWVLHLNLVTDKFKCYSTCFVIITERLFWFLLF